MYNVSNLNLLNRSIESCVNCTRLVNYIKDVNIKKTRRFHNKNYWSKPLSGFGDPSPRLLIIGLAPAAHGGNRTGRMFTGDSSGDWLVRALFETGFSNQPYSIDINDGLILRNVYITSIVKCAPPKNRPLSSEINDCTNLFLKHELDIFYSSSKIVLTLGNLAFATFCKIYKIKNISFKHGLVYELADNKKLIASYHPSKQNTNTRRLTWEMWINIFNRIRSFLDGGNPCHYN